MMHRTTHEFDFWGRKYGTTTGENHLNPCMNCKQRGPYKVGMTQDSWVAECRNCGCLIDIGNPPIGGYK